VIHTLARSVWLPQPRHRTFAFFADATNLERITPPELRFRIVTPAPVECRPGAVIDYRLALFGLPMDWRTLITVWRPGERFVDEQISGPYGMWVHTHRFHDEAGGTRMEDEVRYRLPCSPIGELAWPLVALQLGRIFDYRTRVVAALLGGNATSAATAPVG
jgi:ligand-binding SRPBCC domain-containing protein